MPRPRRILHALLGVLLGLWLPTDAAVARNWLEEVLVPPREIPNASKPRTRQSPPQSRYRLSLFDQLTAHLSPTRAVVRNATGEPPGTVVVDTEAKHLFLVLEEGRALRYGIGVGREGFTWRGRTTVGRKAEWPDWRPPPAMLERQPYLPRYMPGGINNPLGARALYLHAGGRDTMFRIHGTNEAESIGRNVSSGCIRLLNDDVIDLYRRVPVGARVIVR